MKHELVQARDLTGMKLRGQNSMLCGFYRGFAVVTNLNSKARCYDVVVWASRQGSDLSEEVNRWTADYCAQHPFCTGASYNGSILVAHIAMDKKRDVTAQSLTTYYNDVTSFLAAEGMTSPCESCGTSDAAIYDLGGNLHLICPHCMERITQDAKESQKAKPGNLPAGIVGALLFSLAGVALWVLINRLGYVAAICGLALIVCAFKGYEKFSGKIGMAGIVVSVVVALFMGLVSQYICIGLDIYEVFQEYGATLLDSMRSVPSFLSDPELELVSAYLPDLIMGYLFMAVGSFSFIRNAIVAEKHGGHYVEKIADRTGVGAGVNL